MRCCFSAGNGLGEKGRGMDMLQVEKYAFSRVTRPLETNNKPQLPLERPEDGLRGAGRASQGKTKSSDGGMAGEKRVFVDGASGSGVA